MQNRFRQSPSHSDLSFIIRERIRAFKLTANLEWSKFVVFFFNFFNPHLEWRFRNSLFRCQLIDDPVSLSLFISHTSLFYFNKYHHKYIYRCLRVLQSEANCSKIKHKAGTYSLSIKQAKVFIHQGKTRNCSKYCRVVTTKD